jgi:hypothetical protein
VGNDGEIVKGPFRPVAEGVEVVLQPWEVDALVAVPVLLNSVGTGEGDSAAEQLDQTPYPEDAEAADEFRRLMTGELRQSRAADRSAFGITVEQASGGVILSPAEAEAWLRVLGEARLVLAARAGIVADGWEDDLPDDDPSIALLHYLGWVQQSLAEVLEGRLT